MDVKTDIYFHYPYPIAVTFHNADNAREPVEAHDKILKLFEVTLKYLASVMICEYLEDGPDDQQVNRALAGLARPSLGQWNGFLREILTYYQRAGRTGKLLIPGMYDLYFTKGKDRPAMCAAATAMRNFLEDRRDSSGQTSISARECFDRVIQYRNKTTGHGAVTEEQCEALNEPLLAALQELLGVYAVLKDHRLIYVEEVRLVRGKYTHDLSSFMGPLRSRLKNAYVAADPSKYRIEDRLYLCPPNDETPTLSLHPLMIALSQDVLFLNESARDREIEYLSYQTGQIKRPDRLLEDFKEILGAVMAGEGEGLARGAAGGTPLEQARRAFDAGNFAQAIALLGQVAADDPQAAEAAELLERARRRQGIGERLERVRALTGQRRWDDALQAAGALQTELAGSPDEHTTALTELARLRTAEDLYRQALSAYQSQRWERAADLLRQVAGIEPAYRDTPQLLARLENLGGMYARAVQSMAGRDWAESLTTLRQLDAVQPNYKDVPVLLERALKGMDEDAEIAEQYDRVRTQMVMEHWQDAYDALLAIRTRRPAYRDTDELLETVGDKLAVKCWKCSAMIPVGRRFCGRCGAPREKPAPAVTPAGEPATAGVAAGVAAAAVGPATPAPASGAPAAQPVQPQVQSGAPAGATVTCWQCGATNAATRRFCGSCGASRERPGASPAAVTPAAAAPSVAAPSVAAPSVVAAGPATGDAAPAAPTPGGPPSSIPAEPPPATVRCPNCGRENPPARKFCGGCGQPMPPRSR
jgi:hypothetical protein